MVGFSCAAVFADEAEAEIPADSEETVLLEAAGSDLAAEPEAAEEDAEPEVVSAEPAGEGETPEPCTEHSWSGWTETAPTCTEAGSRIRTCTVCGAEETEQIPAKGHTWGGWTVVKNGTCSAQGTRKRTCSACGEAQTEATAKVADAHAWTSWKTTVKATYFKGGKESRSCTYCGKTQTRNIAKLTAKNKWVTDNGNKYYFGNNGKPVTNWQKIKPAKGKALKWCYFDKSGVFKKSVSRTTRKKWVTADGKRFYFSAKKKPLTQGFHRIGRGLYYMGADKAVVIGKFKKNGDTYVTDKKGKIINELGEKNYVLIDLSEQTLKYYKNYKLILSTHVVTGKPGEYATPTGTFSVKYKATDVDLTGPTWNVRVKYWMPFYSGYGMHDASWRSSAEFQNKNTYKYAGSHGCVNMSFSAAQKMYRNISVGTKVIIRR